jgi:hypothetical protein
MPAFPAGLSSETEFTSAPRSVFTFIRRLMRSVMFSTDTPSQECFFVETTKTSVSGSSSCPRWAQDVDAAIVAAIAAAAISWNIMLPPSFGMRS